MKDKNARSELIYSKDISRESLRYLLDFAKIEICEENDENADSALFYLGFIASEAAEKAGQPEYTKMTSYAIESIVKNGEEIIQLEFERRFEHTLFGIGRSLWQIIASAPEDLFNKQAEKAIKYTIRINSRLNSIADEDFELSQTHTYFDLNIKEP